MRFDLVTIVWGVEFSALFADTVLPSLLRSGNIVDLARRGEVRYTIITTAADAPGLERSSGLAELKTLADVKWVFFSPEQYGNDFSAAHRAIGEQTKIFFDGLKGIETCVAYLCPDGILSAGSLAKAADRLAAGKRAVVVSGLRLDKEPFLAALRSTGDDWLGSDLSGRALCGRSLPYLHPMTKALFWEAEQTMSHWPSVLLWPVGQEGLIAHAFHLHPLMVKLGREFTPAPNTTIDGALVRVLCRTPKSVHIVQDSDEALYVELSVASHNALGIRAGRFEPDAVARWGNAKADKFHWSYFRRPIRFHTRGVGESWATVEKDVRRVVRTIFRRSLRAILMPRLVRYGRMVPLARPLFHFARRIVEGLLARSTAEPSTREDGRPNGAGTIR